MAVSTAWTRAGLPLTTEAVAPTPSEWHGTPDPSTARDLAAGLSDRLGKAETAIVDTRSDASTRGEAGACEARRRDSRRRPPRVEEQSDAGWHASSPLPSCSAMYEASGVTPDREVVTYCQGGYRAAHTYLALRLPRLPARAQLHGSWKEWGDRDDLPLERPAPRKSGT